MTEKAPIAVVSGGTGALGAVIVGLMRERGFAVAVPVRESSDARHGSDRVTGVRYLTADITTEAGVAGFFRSVVETEGGVDILVNAAGGYAGGATVDRIALEEWQNMLTANLTTAFLMSREALRIMKPRGHGRIVSIAAKTGVIPEAGKASYAVAKRGVITLTETMAAEVHGTGITVNAIAPGIILTAANRAWMTPEVEAKAVAPGAIASAVLFLCSREAGAVNGTTLTMYGGL